MAVNSRLSGWAAVLFGVAMSAVLAAGCAKARAATVPNGPPLAMPLPPPRVFSPVEEEPLQASPAVAEAPASGAPRVTESRPPGRGTNKPRESEKAEAPLPAATAPTVEIARELRAAATPADADAERKIRGLLKVATSNLENVDYGRLSTAGKEQYDQARSFATQGDAALTQRNYVFAETLADKAAKLATELRGQ
jgi:hypothetical protein